MGLLGREPKISIEEFCREFYDAQIFRPIIAGTDVGSVFLETVFNSVVEADQSFAEIDKAVFWQEMTAIRLELFGLAWGHRFKQDKFTIPQSVFTRHYLEDNEKFGIWDIMGEYNQAIAESITMTESGGQMDAWQVAKANKARADMFDKWADANIGDPSDPTEQEEILANCVARVANRIGADIRRNDCILVKRLTARLAERLGCSTNLNAEALFRLGAVIFGLYQGAKETMKSVNLQAV
jgi:hypothetical protein